ncbi:hypothetical protein LCGC14_2136680 [marine sediment metagenome]|uniref:Uncharacterized protein n=1 Tax=marine sediment metagenome TaxID=412755 RepID=A0A0F9DZT4_9ZZZZ
MLSYFIMERIKNLTIFLQQLNEFILFNMANKDTILQLNQGNLLLCTTSSF